MKAFLLAGTNSGSGKTTMTLGILKALCRRGLNVQPFKVGPDYIDTAWHSRVCQVASHNLDPFMLSSQRLNALFEQKMAGKDVAVIEGVMGLYDGYGTDPYYCSSAGISKKLCCPTILIVNGQAMSTSAAAIVSGFQTFADGSNIAGVVFNQVNSDHHYQLLKSAVESHCHVPVLGRLPQLPQVALPSRHLGLVTAHEGQQLDEAWETLTDAVEQYIDLDRLLDLARRPAVDSPIVPLCDDLRAAGEGLTVAIARDEAFNFYYQANLDLLEQSGARLHFFSPLHDERLPECEMVYLGGGYPELYAAGLSNNITMRQSILAAHQAGVAIYGECGGLMYLGAGLTDTAGDRYPMAGVLDGESHMTGKLCRFGYCRAMAVSETLLCHEGEELLGHEFHYSDFTTSLPTAFNLSKSRDGRVLSRWRGGYQVGNTLAMYLHVHFAQSPRLLQHWFARGRQQ